MRLVGNCSRSKGASHDKCNIALLHALLQLELKQGPPVITRGNEPAWHTNHKQQQQQHVISAHCRPPWLQVQ